MGLILGWQVDKIYLYPYGGITKFNEDINRPLKEELSILLSGPLVQLLYFLLFKNIIDDVMFNYYHFVILLFNLLPIYPLDGGRILNIIFNYFLSFRISYYLSIIISFIFSVIGICFLVLNNYSFNVILMIIIVLSKTINEYKKRKYYFNKFILERYLKNYNFKKTKTINNLKKMMRDKYHIIKKKDIYYKEKDYLKKLYLRK